jgi:hypothetical protein
MRDRADGALAEPVATADRLTSRRPASRVGGSSYLLRILS